MAEMNLADIAEKMRDVDFTILSTRSESGAISGRPMSNNREVEFDGDAYFFSCEHHHIVADIARDPQVGLGFQGKAGALGLRPFFLAIEGRAELIRDKARFEDHWTSGLDRWFEEGIDTPGLVLIKVSAERLHCWNGGDEGELRLGARTEGRRFPDQAGIAFPCARSE